MSETTKQSPEKKYKHVRLTTVYHEKLTRIAERQNRKLIDQLEVLIDLADQTPAPSFLYPHRTTDREA